MPSLQRPDVLAVIYQATSKLIQRGAVPSTPVGVGHSIFRAVDASRLPKPAPGGHVSRAEARKQLLPRDGASDLGNRFSGPSGNAAIPAAAGLYCVLQQQALVNEVMHYTGKPGTQAFTGKCVLEIRLLSSLNCFDLSPHNPGHARFLNELANTPGVRQKFGSMCSPIDLWNAITDSSDCSVARGIGLAVANSTAYRGLIAETVRQSERSVHERGDNVILYGTSMQELSMLSPWYALYFDDGANSLETFPVQFP